MLEPCGHRLIVKPLLLEDVDTTWKAAKAAGLAIPDLRERRLEKAAIARGTVLAIGPTAWKDFQSGPWCQVGDIIMFAKYSGSFVKETPDSDEVVVLNDEDVILVIKE